MKTKKVKHALEAYKSSTEYHHIHLRFSEFENKGIFDPSKSLPIRTFGVIRIMIHETC